MRTYYFLFFFWGGGGGKIIAGRRPVKTFLKVFVTKYIFWHFTPVWKSFRLFCLLHIHWRERSELHRKKSIINPKGLCKNHVAGKISQATFPVTARVF